MTTIDWDALLSRARAVQRHAYAPYSGYPVGAAVLSRSGTIFVGCNVESATFGLTLCAERAALAAMVSSAEREPAAIVIVTPGPEVGMPCGMCRQALAELCDDLPIRAHLTDADDPRVETSLRDLLPLAFRGHRLRRFAGP
jgi:cytidine deaminase